LINAQVRARKVEVVMKKLAHDLTEEGKKREITHNLSLLRMVNVYLNSIPVEVNNEKYLERRIGKIPLFKKL
jgi:hypothetical protein